MRRSEARLIAFFIGLFFNMFIVGINMLIQCVTWIIAVCIPGLSNSRALRTSDRGWVYVISNPSLGNILKIGMTTRSDYQVRIDELNRSTSIPTAFRVEYVYPCQDPLSLERKLHQVFSSRRVNDKREFFDVSVDEVRNRIEQLEGVVESKWFNWPAIGLFASLFVGVFVVNVINNEPSRTVYTPPQTSSKAPAYTYKVVAESLNVRKAPSSKAAVINELKLGQSVTITRDSGQWVKVFNDEVSGWVSSKYLRKV